VLINKVFDVGIRKSRFVLTFDILKAGEIMTEQKFGTKFLSRFWLKVACCAEKINSASYGKTNMVRLFKV